jgi:hypothetical protein
MLPRVIFGAPLGTPSTQASPKSLLGAATNALQDLATALREVDAQTIGLGHNNPPEEIEPNTFRGDLSRAIQAVETLRDEIASRNPREAVVQSNAMKVAQSGVNWAAWFGARGTKAADSAIATVVPLLLLGLAALALKAVIALTQLMPALF